MNEDEAVIYYSETPIAKLLSLSVSAFLSVLYYSTHSTVVFTGDQSLSVYLPN